MRVHLVTDKTIEGYAENNPQSRGCIKEWLRKLYRARWNKPEDIIETYGTVDLLGNGTNRVVFDLWGNRYRLICQYHFGKTKVHLYICWIGTHTHYTKLCGDSRQYTINNY